MTLEGEPCSACKGKGQRRCPTCRGNRQVVRAADGTVHAPHTPLGRAIGRKKMVDCPACQARGAVRCTDCNGSGRRPAT